MKLHQLRIAIIFPSFHPFISQIYRLDSIFRTLLGSSMSNSKEDSDIPTSLLPLMKSDGQSFNENKIQSPAHSMA